MKAWVPAENRLVVVNSWSKPRHRDAVLVTQPVTVPCATPIVGTCAARAARLIDPYPASSAASSSTDRFRSLGRADRRRHDRLVDRRDAGEDGPRSGGDRIEAPGLRGHAAAILHQRDLAEAIRHEHRVPAAEQRKDRQGAGRLVRERPLQHQHWAVVGETPDLAREALDRRAVHVERMVCRVARDHGRITPRLIAWSTAEAEASARLVEVLPAEVQVRKLRHLDHESSFRRLCVSVLSTCRQHRPAAPGFKRWRVQRWRRLRRRPHSGPDLELALHLLDEAGAVVLEGCDVLQCTLAATGGLLQPWPQRLVA